MVLLASFSGLLQASPNIETEQVKIDMQFLADDARNGRAIGSAGITETEDYIAEQFAKLNLQALVGQSSFKQQFQLHSYQGEQLSVSVNNQVISNEQLTIVGNLASVDWQLQSVARVFVGRDDDLKATLAQLNSAGKSSVVIINPAHQELFARYKSKFERGISFVEQKPAAALVLVMSEQTELTQLSVKASIKHSQQTLTNMVAVLPGKSLADEFIIFSAHHDHLGIASNKSGDIIYNGANDDASGVSAVLNLARHFSKQDNQRSIMFVTFTAEESGLIGSNYFAKKVATDNIKAMINIELIGKPSKFGTGTFWMTGFERSTLANILNNNLKSSQRQVYADPYEKYNLFYRSDNASLAKLGVPAHSISSTQIDNDKDYHQVSDELDNLDLEQMTTIINAIAEASTSLITGADTPARIKLPAPSKDRLLF